MISSDRLDLLIDLKGGQQSPADPCLSPRAAAVRWLGYPGTVGSRKFLDYLIDDPTVAPLTHASYYAEALALMPTCNQPNGDQREIGHAMSRLEA